MANIAPETKFRFSTFELDVQEYALRRQGQAVRLERRAMDLLILLVHRRNHLVSRTEIVDRLWGKGVFVDIETGVNTAIRKVRQALHDDPDAPAFVETVPSKGYRFIAEVEVLGNAPVPAKPQTTLAVLPFENIGADPEREYLADGFTEESIVALGQVDPEHLCVIGRTSVTRYKRTTKSLSEIGGELGVAYLIEGSIRAEGERLRITSRLIRVQDQIQIWSSSYENEPGSLLMFQRELSIAIAEQIRLRLSPERLNLLKRRHTLNSEAYDFYLRGRHMWNQLTPPTTRRAIEYFQRATALDPDYALAWSGLADAYSSSPVNGDAPVLGVWPLARVASEHAVGAEPELAEAQCSFGLMNFFLGWDWPAAETAFRKAISLDPGYPLAHRMLGVLLAHMGRHPEAEPCIRRARELDPLYAMHHALSAQVAFAGRDYSAAVRFAKQAIVVDPEFWIGHFQLAQACEQTGQHEKAFEALNLAGRLSGGNSKVLSLRGYLLARLGKKDEAAQIMSTLQAISNERFLPPYALALVSAGMGEDDSAIQYLQRALSLRDVHLTFLPIDPKWDMLRGDKRFAKLLLECDFMKEVSGEKSREKKRRLK